MGAEEGVGDSLTVVMGFSSSHSPIYLSIEQLLHRERLYFTQIIMKERKTGAGEDEERRRENTKGSF